MQIIQIQIQFIVGSRGAYRGDLNIDNDTIDETTSLINLRKVFTAKIKEKKYSEYLDEVRYY